MTPLIKKRNRGSSDQQTLLSLIYTLANGDRAISDVDRLAADHARRTLLGLKDVPNHRRLSEYLTRFNLRFVKKFYDICHIVASILLDTSSCEDKYQLFL